MARYFLNLDPHNPTPGDINGIRKILKREFGSVGEGMQLFSFLFHAEEKAPQAVARRLESLMETRINVAFTVINLDEETIAYGESYLSYFNRMAERAWKAMVGKRTVTSRGREKSL